MARPYRYLTAMVFWLLIGVATLAQPAVPLERQLDFTVFSAQPIDDLTYLPRPDATPVPLVFYPTARSLRYSYSGPATLRFYHARTGAIAVEIDVPPEIRTALLILSARGHATDAALHYEATVVNDDALSHAPGSLLILNFSGLTLSGSINRQPMTLLNGINAPIRVGRDAAINLRTPFKARTYQAYAETIALEESGRALLLLLPPYRQGSLEVQSRVLVDSPLDAPGAKRR